MSLYEDLGVPKDADAPTIKRAHRKAARRTHPDAGGKRDDFERIQRAAIVLCDPAKRARYDETGETETKPDNPMAEFAEIIIPAFDQALDEAAERLEMIDVMASTKAKLRQMVSNATVSIGQAKAASKRFDKALARLRFKGNGIYALDIPQGWNEHGTRQAGARDSDHARDDRGGRKRLLRYCRRS